VKELVSQLIPSTRMIVLVTSLGLLAVLALWAPGGSGQPLSSLTVGEAEAAKCPGASRSPKRLSRREARNLVVCLVNRRRSKAGVRRLKKKSKVVRAATQHTKRMKRTNCLSHVCPGEPPLPVRLQQTNYLPCGCSWGVGENIAWGKGRNGGSPRAIVDQWMRSSPHRSTLLNGSFEHVGVGFRRGGPTSSSRKAGTYTIDFGFKR
jgi:uncharacterized protein YkwD